MIAALKRTCFVLSVVLLSVAAVHEDESPIAKVIALLERLSAQIEKEGAKEAAEYDKFACFCKEQASDKKYAIDKSDEKIKVLEAEIEKLEADIKELNAEITELTTRIDEIDKEVTTANETRTKEHEAYVKQDEDMDKAITALAEAIKVLKEDKKKLKDAKLDLGQLQAVVNIALSGVSKSPAHVATQGQQFQKSMALLQAEPGQPHAYEYSSNDIIGTLENLMDDFKEEKKELYLEEFNKTATFDSKVLDLKNEKKFKEEDKAEKEGLVSEKTEKKAADEKDKEEETTARDADQGFLDELTSDCEDKATEWDTRSKTRADELNAISQAIDHLKSGVKDNYEANKNLAGIQKSQVVKLASRVDLDVHQGKGMPSFLQLRGTSQKADAVQKALQSIDEASQRLHSQMLSALATKATLEGDSFAKVKGLINDLIKKLEDEAKDEASSKTFCDKELTKAVDDRDKSGANIEGEEATIAQKTAAIQGLENEVAELSSEIADDQKALNEATELRAEEKAANEQTLAEAGEGKAAVEQAIIVLKDFYNANALLQRDGPDREGKTVSDLAPELSYSGEDYKGKQEQGTGVIAILEMIKEDFERTVSETETAETDAQSKFKTFESDTKTSVGDKEKEMNDKEDDIKDAKDAITDAKDTLLSATELRDNALEQLEKLKAMCVEGAGSWEERKKQREAEIAALKDALKILEDW